MADIASIVSSTAKVYGKQMHDNIFTSIPLYAILNEKGKVEQAEGPYVVESVIMAENTTVAFGDPKGQMTITEQNPVRAIQWGLKTCKGLVPVYKDYDIRSPKLAKTLIQNLEDTMTSVVGKAMFASGGGYDLQGLDCAISATSTYGSVMDADGNVEAINRAVTGAPGAINVLWRSNTNSVTGALTVGSGANSMWTMYDTCKANGGLGGGEPDLIVTTDALYAAYNATLTTNQRYVDEKVGNLGFDNLKFRNAVVVADPNCPEGCMYFLNTKHLKLYESAETWRTIGMSTAIPMADYLASVIQAYWWGNLICTRPNSMGVLSGKS